MWNKFYGPDDELKIENQATLVIPIADASKAFSQSPSPELSPAKFLEETAN